MQNMDKLRLLITFDTYNQWIMEVPLKRLHPKTKHSVSIIFREDSQHYVPSLFNVKPEIICNMFMSPHFERFTQEAQFKLSKKDLHKVMGVSLDTLHTIVSLIGNKV